MFEEFINDVWWYLNDKKIVIKKKDLAERIGVTYNTLRSFMQGKENSRATAERICDYFDTALIYMNGKYRMVEKCNISGYPQRRV